MGDTDEDYRAMREESKRRRAGNRARAVELLRQYGVEFAEHNSGYHLIIRRPEGEWDLWPGTGLWKNRKGKEGRGIFSMLRAMGVIKGRVE